MTLRSLATMLKHTGSQVQGCTVNEYDGLIWFCVCEQIVQKVHCGYSNRRDQYTHIKWLVPHTNEPLAQNEPLFLYASCHRAAIMGWRAIRRIQTPRICFLIGLYPVISGGKSILIFSMRWKKGCSAVLIWSFDFGFVMVQNQSSRHCDYRVRIPNAWIQLMHKERDQYNNSKNKRNAS